MSVKEKIIKADLLFHSVHGLCRVAAVTRPPVSPEVTYTLVPVAITHARVRFTVPLNSLESSGFNKLITPKQANAILEYFKTGQKKESAGGSAWLLAMMIWTESCSKESVKDVRKRQRLERSVNGLAEELALVLKTTAFDIAEKMQTNLAALTTINPLVLSALASIEPY
jgi:RNA polymerase-interacting CarD/CdnL/TRCF family regulator